MYVESKAYFKMPKSYILGQIREPGCLNRFHPFCKRNIAHKWPGNGSNDELEYLNGRKYKRYFFNWTDNGYDLKIAGKKEMAIVNWYVEGSDEECSLRVRINPNIKNYPTDNLFNLINKNLSKRKLENELKIMFESKLTKLYKLN